MSGKQRRVVNSKSAVQCIVYPIAVMPMRTPEMNRQEILKPVEAKKRLPGTAILIKMAKDRAKAKEKNRTVKLAAAVSQHVDINSPEIQDALENIMAKLEE